MLRRLASGVKVRFLVFDPHSSHLGDLAADFDQSPAELQSECEKGLNDLLELQKRWQLASGQSQTPGELDVRVFNTPPHARMYVFDPQRSQGRTLFIPYVSKIDSGAAPGYLLQNVQTGVFVQYFGALQKLWSSSETLEQHLQNPAPVH